MNHPFSPPPGPFGFGPADRRFPPQQRRQARCEFREHLREHRHDPSGAAFQANIGFEPGGGFEFGFDPRGGFGVGFGAGPRGRGRPGRGGRRGKRGDVRAAILTLLVDRPMHGYEMIQEIAERSGDLWRPSPGSVYPTLQLLVDEGLIVATESSDSGSKKLFELTDDGRSAAEKIETAPWDEIADGVQDADPGQVSMRKAVMHLMGAVAQSAHAATEEQQQRIVDIVNNARREIYQILGESD